MTQTSVSPKYKNKRTFSVRMTNGQLSEKLFRIAGYFAHGFIHIVIYLVKI